MNIHDFVAANAWTEPNCIDIILYGMSKVWVANDETLAHLLDKAHALSREEAEDLVMLLNDYYTDADNSIGGGDFERVERERWPDMKEEEYRIKQTHYFGPERRWREALAQGKEEGLKQGIEQGKLEMVKRFLLEGADEQLILKVAKLSKQELNKIKESLV